MPSGCFPRTMECANILGANCYTFHGIARIKRTFREDLERSGEQTRAIAEVCGRYGVALCYENVEWALYNPPGRGFPVLKEHCPALRGVLDLKQARITGYDYFDYLKEMGSALSHVHVSDITAEGKMCLPGKGITDFPAAYPAASRRRLRTGRSSSKTIRATLNGRRNSRPPSSGCPILRNTADKGGPLCCK